LLCDTSERERARVGRAGPGIMQARSYLARLSAFPSGSPCHTRTQALIHPDIPTLGNTHSLIHSLTRSLCHSLSLSLTHSISHQLTHSLTHARTHAPGQRLRESSWPRQVQALGCQAPLGAHLVGRPTRRERRRAHQRPYPQRVAGPSGRRRSVRNTRGGDRVGSSDNNSTKTLSGP
jgi:hypothetical protein